MLLLRRLSQGHHHSLIVRCRRNVLATNPTTTTTITITHIPHQQPSSSFAQPRLLLHRAISSSGAPFDDDDHNHGHTTTHTKKKRRGPSSRASPPPPPPPHPQAHPAIDNSGILIEGEEPSPPMSAMPVSGSRMQGGNVVWRASGRNLEEEEAAAAAEEVNAEAKAALWEKANSHESLISTKDPRGPVHPTFKSLGVIEPKKELDLQLMISNYTTPALAAGLRDREETLQLCARLLADGHLEQLEKVLHPYQEGLITRRRRKTRSLDLAGGLTSKHLNMLRKYLQRSPRHLTRAVSLRASVVIPLCNVNGVASVLFERRSSMVRSFKNQVCFPGGMVEESLDINIIETSLREMEEEIGFPAKSVDVLGVLRCDWSEVHKITGIGVTPVVGFLGDLTERKLSPNPEEVAECFTIPLSTLLEKEHWNYEEEKGTVVFVGGPHVIWGLTAYILDRFLEDILLRYKIILNQ